MSHELSAISSHLASIKAHVAAIAQAPAVTNSARGGMLLRQLVSQIFGELRPLAVYHSPDLDGTLGALSSAVAVTTVAELKGQYAELSGF